MLKRPLHLALYYLSMFFFGVSAMALNTVCWLLSFVSHSRRTEGVVRHALYRLMRFWQWYLDKMNIVKVSWTDIEKLRGRSHLILVANHPSLLDICWLLAVSERVTCIIKSEIRKNNFFNATARMAGMISNDSGMAGLHNAVDKVNSGDILVVFPEGTRTRSAQMNPFKHGFALIAKQARVPMQTLLIRSHTKNFTKGVFFRCGPLPLRFDVKLGPLLEPEPHTPAHRQALRVEKAMRSVLESASTWN